MKMRETSRLQDKEPVDNNNVLKSRKSKYARLECNNCERMYEKPTIFLDRKKEKYEILKSMQ